MLGVNWSTPFDELVIKRYSATLDVLYRKSLQKSNKEKNVLTVLRKIGMFQMGIRMLALQIVSDYLGGKTSHDEYVFVYHKSYTGL